GRGTGAAVGTAVSRARARGVSGHAKRNRKRGIGNGEPGMGKMGHRDWGIGNPENRGSARAKARIGLTRSSRELRAPRASGMADPGRRGGWISAGGAGRFWIFGTAAARVGPMHSHVDSVSVEGSAASQRRGSKGVLGWLLGAAGAALISQATA